MSVSQQKIDLQVKLATNMPCMRGVIYSDNKLCGCDGFSDKLVDRKIVRMCREKKVNEQFIIENKYVYYVYNEPDILVYAIDLASIYENIRDMRHDFSSSINSVYLGLQLLLNGDAEKNRRIEMLIDALEAYTQNLRQTLQLSNIFLSQKKKKKKKRKKNLS